MKCKDCTQWRTSAYFDGKCMLHKAIYHTDRATLAWDGCPDGQRRTG